MIRMCEPGVRPRAAVPGSRETGLGVNPVRALLHLEDQEAAILPEADPTEHPSGSATG
ncbi:MAG: hypothetical protein RQ745_11035 [Longimicrobiales bacterium]|nr:hypothetical protein [Longimicrobiales bacterium]